MNIEGGEKRIPIRKVVQQRFSLYQLLFNLYTEEVVNELKEYREWIKNSRKKYYDVRFSDDVILAGN